MFGIIFSYQEFFSLEQRQQQHPLAQQQHQRDQPVGPHTKNYARNTRHRVS